MKCREIEGHLPTYLNEELSGDLRRQIKAHLRGCKKCRARMEEMKAETTDPERKEAALEGTARPKEKAASPSSKKGAPSSGWKYPIEAAAVALLMIGGLYVYQRGGSDSKANLTVMEKEATPIGETAGFSPPAAEHDGKEPGPTPPVSEPPPPSAVPAPVPPPAKMAMKVHKATTQALSREARHQAAGKPMPMKLLLISRDSVEAAQTVASRAAASSGKVLSQKGGASGSKMVLLVPADRYEGFLQSLQPLGLVKDLSKRPPPFQGSLKVEMTIE